MNQPSVDQKLDRLVPNINQHVRQEVVRPRNGRVRRVVGVVVHATVEEVRLGEICNLVDPKTGTTRRAEVVGLDDDQAVLLPLGDLTGLSSLTEVVPTGSALQVSVSPGLLGRVINAFGEPLDNGPIEHSGVSVQCSVHGDPPPPFARAPVSDPTQLGIRAIDGLLTCARGQRLGIFGEPGVGKSLLLSDVVRGTDADIAVVALVGERGREVREFVERQVKAGGMDRTIVVAATSDRPAIERMKAAYVATTIAEYFRDQGKHVLLALDNMTRFARAQREIGLASGEPPTRRGFPPSLFATLPKLLERSGPGERGTITGLYSVLLEGDGTLDPVAEEMQALLDGHVFLSAELAQRNHFPAIDVLRSRSRLMDTVVPARHRLDAGRIRELMASHAEVELLLRVGEYKKGNDAVADEAIAKIDRINDFLRQEGAGSEPLSMVEQRMREIVDEEA